jgi:hypothetical protein
MRHEIEVDIQTLTEEIHGTLAVQRISPHIKYGVYSLYLCVFCLKCCNAN